MGLFDFLSGKKKKVSLEKADKINDDFIAKNPVPKDNENAEMRRASKLLTSKNYQEALDLYAKMAEKYPKNRGLYLSQVGTCHYFLGNYEKAIEVYVESRENGMDKSMIDDNIFEVCEAIYNQSNEKSTLEKYFELCPNGSYTKKINKLLKQ